MNQTTINTNTPTATNVEAMVRTIQEARRMVEWTLIAPDGRVWITDDPAKLFAVLTPYHPLLKGLL